ncbi:MAG: hypothetical protein ACJAT6_000334 [Akkermansiaceae bacterium]|jgi:hypothetical protein|tara:strand:- start:6826 stop:6999 length:174 start_codon:yes stop_codon:yes gene_type:complete
MLSSAEFQIIPDIMRYALVIWFMSVGLMARVLVISHFDSCLDEPLSVLPLLLGAILA